MRFGVFAFGILIDATEAFSTSKDLSQPFPPFPWPLSGRSDSYRAVSGQPFPPAAHHCLFSAVSRQDVSQIRPLLKRAWNNDNIVLLQSRCSCPTASCLLEFATQTAVIVSSCRSCLVAGREEGLADFKFYVKDLCCCVASPGR